MTLTRDELAETFNQLELVLAKLKAEGQPEEAFWAAFERLVQMPSPAIISHRPERPRVVVGATLFDDGKTRSDRIKRWAGRARISLTKLGIGDEP